MKLQRSPVVFHLLPAFLLSLSSPLFSTAAARGRPGGHLLLALAANASRPTFSTALALALELSSPCHAPQRPPPAATSLSLWQARIESQLPFLSRASKPGGSPRPIPLIIAPFPRPQTPEHLRHSPKCRRASSSPSTHSSKAAQPASTSPLAPPRSSTANRPPIIDHPPPEHPCRRAPPSPQPCPPWTALLRPSPIAPRAPEGAARSLLRFAQPLPRRRRAETPEKAGHRPSLFPIRPGTSLLEFKETQGVICLDLDSSE